MLFNEFQNLLHRGISKRPPDFEFYLFVVIEKLTDTFYLKHQTEVVPGLVFLSFLAVAKTCNFDVVEVTYALAREVRHEVV